MFDCILHQRLKKKYRNRDRNIDGTVQLICNPFAKPHLLNIQIIPNHFQFLAQRHKRIVGPQIIAKQITDCHRHLFTDRSILYLGHPRNRIQGIKKKMRI